MVLCQVPIRADSVATVRPAVNKAARRAELRPAQTRSIDIADMRTMRIAVTGSFGCSGRYITRRLAAARLALLLRAHRLPISEDVGAVASGLVQSGLIPDRAASMPSTLRWPRFTAWITLSRGISSISRTHSSETACGHRLQTQVADLGFCLPVICSPEELLQYDEDE